MEESFFWIYHKLSDLERNGLLRELPPPFEYYDVSRGTFYGKEFLVFCSNDYLGMTRKHEVLEELRNSVEVSGSGASRLVSGNFKAHRDFEEFISSEVFELKDKGVLLFNSGWSANVGVISALADDKSEIFSDELNHASIIDGCRLSKAKVTVFPHLDMNFLEDSLSRSSAKFKLVVVDSVFSMDGDIAPLKDIRYLCDKYGACMYVDEAHAFGVFGEKGRGLCEEKGVEPDIALFTLSKAVGLYGAFVLAPKRVLDYLKSTARSFIFATAIPPYICRAAVVSIRIIMREPETRKKLWNNVSFLLGKMKQKLKVDLRTSSQIVPFIIGDEIRTLQVSQLLFEKGIFVRGIRYPSVPRGTARLRITVSAAHSPEEIERFTEELSKVMEEVVR